jgi:hypothetical protein
MTLGNLFIGLVILIILLVTIMTADAVNSFLERVVEKVDAFFMRLFVFNEGGE